MQLTKDYMGMSITVQIVDSWVTQKTFEKVFDYFQHVDEKFSTYKETSEISKINRGEVPPEEFSEEMKDVFSKATETKNETNGYFDILDDRSKIDPSGLVKGWAIFNASEILKAEGFVNFFIDAGGDIQVSGKNEQGETWSVGIKNPFKQDEIVKVFFIENQGIATSGTYIRGQHIYNPHNRGQKIDQIVSLTVIGPNVYEADRFATAAFAMGREGIGFIEKLAGFEGFMIDKDGIGIETSGISKFTQK